LTTRTRGVGSCDDETTGDSSRKEGTLEMPLSHIVGGLRVAWLGATDDPHFLLWPVLVAIVATAFAVRAARHRFDSR
jgi:hypothetical protein